MSITNRFSGICRTCDTVVSEGQGYLHRDSINDRSYVTHRRGECDIVALTRGANIPKPLSSDMDDAMRAVVTGTSLRKPPTLEEAADAFAPHLPEAEVLDGMLSAALQEAVKAISRNVADSWTSSVPAMVADILVSARPMEIKVNDLPAVKMAKTHKCFEDALLMVVAGASPFLVGPAGSGKTTLAEQIAKALSRKFYMAARVTSEYKMVGFIDANGHCVRTQFRDAYEHGGIFIFDEVDASDPDAMTAFNAALASGYCDFPDGMVNRHVEFAAIAAGNTFGRGADRQYVGRNQLDAATLDRFQILEVDYDEELEMTLAGNVDWTRYVQRVRKAVETEKVRHVVSPRASIMGARLLAAGMSQHKVAEATIWKGMEAGQRARVESAAIRSI